jgi:hypothetical protein
MAVTIPQGLLDAFETAQHSIFRLETLQHYAGDREAELGEAKQHWCDLVRRRTADGVTMTRVHVVEHPLTDYMRFELTQSYPPNTRAGEDVRIVPAPVKGLPERFDFWMFDESSAWLMRYDDAGQLTAVLDVSDDGSKMDICRYYARVALERSTPLLVPQAS